MLYDIGVLGAGYARERSRTGVYRVVEKVAQGLAAQRDLELFFCASGDGKMAEKYLHAHRETFGNSLLYPSRLDLLRQDAQRRCRNGETALTAKIEQAPAIAGWYKLQRMALYKIRKSLATGPIPPRVLAGKNIYHSPFMAIPLEVRGAAGLSRFLTVYDLIPVLYPQWFQVKEDITVKNAIESLGGDGWAFTISQSTKDDLCNLYPRIRPERVKVTHLAAAPEVFYPYQHATRQQEILVRHGIPARPYFLSLCTLEPRKNIDHVIRCFSRLVKEGQLPEVNLVLVGTKGWHFDRIFQEIESDPSVRSKINVTGFVPDEELAAIYSGSIGFVYTSLYEGFGLPPLEAMQCGVPVITSNNSSLPEVVGDAGIMVDAKDEDALCQAMLRVYKSESLRERLSKKSLEQAAKFSWEKCVQQTVAGYKMALSG